MLGHYDLVSPSCIFKYCIIYLMGEIKTLEHMRSVKFQPDVPNAT